MCCFKFIFAKLFYFLYYRKEIVENYDKMRKFADEYTKNVDLVHHSLFKIHG